MRTVASEVETRGVRGQADSGSRSAAARKVRLRRLALGGLEARTLLAVLPAATVTGQIDVSGASPRANETAPSIAIDPNSPQDMVAVWTIDSMPGQNTLSGGQTNVYVQAAYSTNSGQSWSPLGNLG